MVIRELCGLSRQRFLLVLLIEVINFLQGGKAFVISLGN